MVTNLKVKGLLDRTVQIYHILMIDETTPITMKYRNLKQHQLSECYRFFVRIYDLQIDTIEWCRTNNTMVKRIKTKQIPRKTISGVFKIF